jgi:hypothetical protein
LETNPHGCTPNKKIYTYRLENIDHLFNKDNSLATKTHENSSIEASIPNIFSSRSSLETSTIL